MNPTRVLIAPDKFKGTLTSSQVAEAIGRGLHRSKPAWELTLMPIADGGEGTTDAVLVANPEYVRRSVLTYDALMRLRMADIAQGRETAVIECAAAVGLAHISSAERDPWRSSSRGVGMLIANAARHGARKVLVGLGGSATNDGGLGLAVELGWQFLNSSGTAIDPIPLNFASIKMVVRPEQPLGIDVVGLCDVSNPLTGPSGASHVYGPQKGLRDPSVLDAELARIAGMVANAIGADHSNFPGAGAAGGLGYGLLAFCGAELTSGFGYIAELIGVEAAVRSSDLVVTGEGRIDRQTFYGKGPAELAGIGKRHNKTTVAFCGIAESGMSDFGPFDHILPLVSSRVTLADALQNTAQILEDAASQFAWTTALKA